MECQSHQDQLKFKVYISDLMIKFVEKLGIILGKSDIPATEKGRSITVYDQKSKTSQSNYILDNISAQVFTPAYRSPIILLKDITVFKDIIKAQAKVCHKTGSDFARILSIKQFKDPVIINK